MPAHVPAAAVRPFVIPRVVEAPRELVWQAWTELDRLKQWWGPKGFKVFSAALDLRPGDAFHYGMRALDGQTMWGKFVYREISAPVRLVFVNSFADEHGNTAPAPFPGLVWPLLTLSTVTFEARGAGTEITVHWEPLDATAEERASFDGMHDSMRNGWTGTFDQLGDYLAASATATAR